jgi:TRAP-type mannitol/chloroaromatic compound transport system substrate-binding protein
MTSRCSHERGTALRPRLESVDARHRAVCRVGWRIPANYKAALDTATATVNSWMLAKYDHDNPMALKRLVANGAQVRVYSQEILNAAFDAAEQIYAGLNAQNSKFKKIFESWDGYRREESRWFRVNERSSDSFTAGRFSR